MAGYDQIIGRADVADAMLPDQIINEIIQTAPEDSVVLTRAKTVRMSSKAAKQAVVSELPDAYWVDGDTGLKQTGGMKWNGVTITAEELAVIVPIPDALIDDTNVPLWDQVRPAIKEAVGKAVDKAVLFGVNKPASWPTGIIPAAIAAGNVSQLSPTKTLADAFLDVAQQVAMSGFAINGFATRPGMNWVLRGLRTVDGQFLFGAPNAGGNATLFGQTMDEVRNGAWDATTAEALAVDWGKFVVGIRQDITYDLFKEGVISDADGKIVLNLMQQDTKALRVVFRVGFAHTIPTNRLGSGGFPAGVILPAA